MGSLTARGLKAVPESWKFNAVLCFLTIWIMAVYSALFWFMLNAMTP
jgi:hypothetical protein